MAATRVKIFSREKPFFHFFPKTHPKLNLQLLFRIRRLPRKPVHSVTYLFSDRIAQETVCHQSALDSIVQTRP